MWYLPAGVLWSFCEPDSTGFDSRQRYIYFSAYLLPRPFSSGSGMRSAYFHSPRFLHGFSREEEIGC
jgi:hypothetical protein